MSDDTPLWGENLRARHDGPWQPGDPTHRDQPSEMACPNCRTHVKWAVGVPENCPQCSTYVVPAGSAPQNRAPIPPQSTHSHKPADVDHTATNGKPAHGGSHGAADT